MKAGSFPLTRRSMAVWPNWKRATESGRRFEECGLHPNEVAGLRQLAGNLHAAGRWQDWFESNAQRGLFLAPKAQATLFRDLRMDAASVAGLVRACAALGVPDSWPLRAVENAARELAGLEPLKTVRLQVDSPAAMAVNDEEEEQAMSMATGTNGVGPQSATTLPSPPPSRSKWRTSETAFTEIYGAAQALGLDLSAPMEPAARKRLMEQAARPESTVYTAAADVREGRKPSELAATPKTDLSEKLLHLEAERDDLRAQLATARAAACGMVTADTWSNVQQENERLRQEAAQVQGAGDAEAAIRELLESRSALIHAESEMRVAKRLLRKANKRHGRAIAMAHRLAFPATEVAP